MNVKNALLAVMAIALVASLGFNVYYATRPTSKVPTPSDTLVWVEDFTGTTTFDTEASTQGLTTTSTTS